MLFAGHQESPGSRLYKSLDQIQSIFGSKKGKKKGVIIHTGSPFINFSSHISGLAFRFYSCSFKDLFMYSNIDPNPQIEINTKLPKLGLIGKLSHIGWDLEVWFMLSHVI
ncbi:hypothetical protein ACJX0J_037185, partial [Zea mays]